MKRNAFAARVFELMTESSTTERVSCEIFFFLFFSKAYIRLFFRLDGPFAPSGGVEFYDDDDDDDDDARKNDEK